MRPVTRWTFLTAGLVALGGLVFWFWAAPGRSLPHYAGPAEKIAISTSADAKSALLFIAQDKGYFSENGLEVTLKTFPSGRMGCEQLKAGKIDLANAADFVLVSEVFDGTTSLRCIGSIAAADDHQVIARKDRGILRPGDLRGKRIGATHGTSAEFFLGRFLAFNNLGLRDVAFVDVNASDLEEALATGRVDAVVVWEQWAYAIKKRLGDRVAAWPGQSGQKYYWLLMSTDSWAKARRGVLERLFKALDQAEIFLKSHKEESIEIVARRINLDPVSIKDSLSRSTLGLSLDQALFIMMEDEARWMIKNKLAGQARVPNYLNYMDAEALLRVNPKAVGLIAPRRAAPQ
ncbi:MAG: NrtA/SsuA/CpmA family ABC transporter substrate-binding protein [Syntrophobacterales bacterium]|jgi:NitT/TauT family transport system substrate-binding protein|nr:NrtA/SsuA/CpmA family ABC transporter substrate-binding protein [Syntrophobacterales bacterium]